MKHQIMDGSEPASLPGQIVLDLDGRILTVSDDARSLLDGVAALQTGALIEDVIDASSSFSLRESIGTGGKILIRLDFTDETGGRIALHASSRRTSQDSRDVVVIQLDPSDDNQGRFTELTRIIDELHQECENRRRVEGDLRKLLGELNNANLVRDRILTTVSHDLRTPLNAIIGLTEFMQSKPFGEMNDRYSEYINDIHTSGRTLLETVERVLSIYSDQATNQEASNVLFSLGECLSNCVRIVEPLAKRKNLSVIIPDEMTLPKLRSDQTLVKQIFLNLIGNAVKYAEEGGEIQVSARPLEDGGYQVHVADNGPGIDEEKVRQESLTGRIDPYVAGNDSAGIGLFLTRRAIAAIGGEFDIRNMPTRGTLAEVNLPSSIVY